MEQNNTRENTEMGEVISTTEAFIEKNKKLLIIVIVAAIALALVIFGVVKMAQNRNLKANQEMFAAEQYFAQGDFEKALNGDGQHAGLLEVADQYSCTKSGKRACYEAGLCYLHMGNFDEAMSFLKKYNGKDAITSVQCEIAMGDVEFERANYDAAIKHYDAAIKASDDDMLTPTALHKAGFAYQMKGDNAKALDYYNKVKQYPQSAEFSIIDKFIGMAESAE